MYVPAIDGLRALAIIGVMLVHAGFPGGELGWLGVDLFFVLSGFLITTLLLNEHKKKGKLDILKFMGRRVLRLFPAYYLYVSLITLALFLGVGTLTPIGQWHPNVILASIWAYFNNFVPRGGFWEYDWLLMHLWSLSVEEQFYLIWPFLLLLALKTSNKLIIPTVVILFLLSIRVLYSDSLDYDDKLHTRGIALFIGSYISILCFHMSGILAFFQKYSHFIFGLVLIMFIGLFFSHELGLLNEKQIRITPIVFVDIFLALMTALIWYAREDEQNRLYMKFLSLQFLVFIGKISYGIYLYHMFSHLVVWQILYVNFEFFPPAINYLIRLSIYLSITILLSYLSYTYFETRFLKIKDKLR